MLRNLWHRLLWRVRPRGIRPCCRQPANLVRTELGPDMSVGICKVCGAKHYRLTAEPGGMGVKVTPLKK